MECVREVEKIDAEGFELAKKSGIQFGQLPPAEVKKFTDLYDMEIAKLAKGLDDKKLPGTRFYQDVRRLIGEAAKK